MQLIWRWQKRWGHERSDAESEVSSWSQKMDSVHWWNIRAWMCRIKIGSKKAYQGRIELSSQAFTLLESRQRCKQKSAALRCVDVHSEKQRWNSWNMLEHWIWWKSYWNGTYLCGHPPQVEHLSMKCRLFIFFRVSLSVTLATMQNSEWIPGADF